MRLLVAVVLVAGALVLTGSPASAAGFSGQVQTPMGGTLNQRSILVGGKDGGSAPFNIPNSGVSNVTGRLFFGAADGGAPTVTEADRLLATVNFNPGGTSTVTGTALLNEGGGSYRYATNLTIPGNANSIEVSGIEGTGASWALLIIYDVALPGGQRSQVTYREGFTKVSAGAPDPDDTVTFTGLAPAKPATSGTLRLAAAAGGAADDAVTFDPDAGVAAFSPAPVPGNNFDVSGGGDKVAFSATVTPAPGAPSATVAFAPPAAGDTYFVMVAVYEVSFSTALLTLGQTLNDTSGTTPAFAGDVVGVTGTVTNTAGRSAAAGAVYSTILPTDTTLVDGKAYTDSGKLTQLPVSITGSALQIGVGTGTSAVGAPPLVGGEVLAGTPATFYYELKTERSNTGSFTVTGDVAYRDLASNTAQTPVQNTSGAIELPALTNLSVALSGVPASNTVGGASFTVTATVTNLGPSDLLVGEATVKIGLVPGLVFATPLPTGCTPDPATDPTSITCPVPALVSGASTTAATSPSASIEAIRPPPPGSRRVTATVATVATTPAQDPVLDNNVNFGDISVIVDTDLRVVLNDLPVTVGANTPFPVSATVFNDGISDTLANEASVAFSFGTALTGTGLTAEPPPAPADCSSSGTATLTTITCKAPAIAAGESWDSPTLSFTGAVNATNPPGPRKITAAVTTTPGDLDSSDNSRDGFATITVTPGLTVEGLPPSKRVPFGDGSTGTFSTEFKISNDAKVAVPGLQVTVEKPTVPTGTVLKLLTLSSPGATCVPATGDAASGTCTYATFPVSSNKILTATWEINTPLALTFTATATAPSPTPGSAMGTQNVEVVSVDLEATASIPTPPTFAVPTYKVGTPFVATFTGTNNGPSATGIDTSVLVITWTAGLNPTGALPTGCTRVSPSAPEIRCTLPVLATGETKSYAIEFTGATKGPQSVTVTAKAPGADTASTADNEEPTSDLANGLNTDVENVLIIVEPKLSVLGAPLTQRVPLGDIPPLTLKTFDTKFTVKNAASTDISMLVVEVFRPAFPGTLNLVGLSSTQGGICDPGTRLCTYATFGSAASDMTATVTATWQIDGVADDLVFTATATAPNPTPGTATGSQTVDVVSVDLEATVAIPDSTAVKGASFTATFTGKNLGPSTTGVGDAASVLVITWAPDLSPTGSLPDGCTRTPNNAPFITCKLPELAAGQSASFDIKFTGSAKDVKTVTVLAKAPGADTVDLTDNEEPTSKVIGTNTATATIRIVTPATLTMLADPLTKRVPVYPGDPTTTFTVTYALRHTSGADIDNLVVTVPTPVLPVDVLPAARNLTAIGAAVSVGSPAGTCAFGTTTTCRFAIFPAGAAGTVTVTYTIEGNDPAPPSPSLEIDFVATVETSVNTPLVPPTPPAIARISLVEAKADLDIVEPIAYESLSPSSGSNLQVGSDLSGTFNAKITLKNLGPDIALSPTITFGPTLTNVEVVGSATCAGNVCSTGSLAKDESRVITVTVRLLATSDGNHDRSAPFTAATTTTEQAADLANNTGLVVGTINRSLVAKQDTGAESGPAVPSGGTLTYKTFSNGDSDPDGDVIKLKANGVATFSPADGSASATIERNENGTLVVKPVLSPDTDPAVDRVVKITIPVTIEDDPAGDAVGVPVSSTLELAVTEAVAEEFAGSFGDAPTQIPTSFGESVADKLVPSVNVFDVLDAERGKNAAGVDFADAPSAGATAYTLTSVDANSINVAGSTAEAVSEPAGAPKLLRYVPAPGYTSDLPDRPGTDLAQAPADSFTYTATGARDGQEVFTVVSPATVKVTNQQPIGVDSILTVFTSNPTGFTDPAGNDIDGNNVGEIQVGGAPFVFDDEGRIVGEGKPDHRLLIACIGPAPQPDGTGALPPALCTDDNGVLLPNMKEAGQELVVTPPADKGVGSITAKLRGAGAEGAFRKVDVAIDDKVGGIIPFAAVVVDNYGGAAWSLVNVEIPDQPPFVIPEVQIVPKNSPPVAVLDSTKAGRDGNGDVVKVSGVTDPDFGTASIQDDTVIMYKPDTDYLGPDDLVLNVSDARGVGSNSALLQIEVVEDVVQADTGAGSEGGGGATPAGNLPTTGGDPLALTAGGAACLLLGFLFVQASRRRRTIPLLAGARHLRT